MDLSLFGLIDEKLFTLVNSRFSFSWLDGLMILFRNQFTWIPLYAFLLVWFYRKDKNIFLLIVLMSLVTFALTDYISASILKPLFTRPRPCHEPGLVVRSLLGCGGNYGMPSSHASNHFGLAMFWFSVISSRFNKKIYLLWAWAFVVCYAQVYVGKHYPGDILGGCILGCFIGFLTMRLFNFFVAYSLRKKKKFSLRMNKSLLEI